MAFGPLGKLMSPPSPSCWLEIGGAKAHVTLPEARWWGWLLASLGVPADEGQRSASPGHSCGHGHLGCILLPQLLKWPQKESVWQWTSWDNDQVQAPVASEPC